MPDLPLEAQEPRAVQAGLDEHAEVSIDLGLDLTISRAFPRISPAPHVVCHALVKDTAVIDIVLDQFLRNF